MREEHGVTRELSEPTEKTWAKYQELRQWLEEIGSVVVAYSGGTDSAFLLRVAHEVLGDRCVGVMADSASVPRAEHKEAATLARQIGAKRVVVECRELDDPRYRANTTDRCYFCRRDQFGRIAAYAREQGFAAVLDGANRDDLDDHRPGHRAAIEHGVRSPLQELAFTKSEIRVLSRTLGLSTWDKPASPCLSSRIPYGTPVTVETLAAIEKSETVIRRLGIREFRVRHHREIARIEVGPNDAATILEHREDLVREIKEQGYLYVTLDLEGFRSGRLNEEREDS